MSSSHNIRFMLDMSKIAALHSVKDAEETEEYGTCPLCKSSKSKLAAASDDGFREVICENGHRRPIPAGKVKTASMADAVLGAPLGALAAMISTKKEDRVAAIRRGLVLGALAGFVQGQRANKSMSAEEEHKVMSPALVSLLAGMGAGLYGRKGDLPSFIPGSEKK